MIVVTPMVKGVLWRKALATCFLILGLRSHICVTPLFKGWELSSATYKYPS